MSIDTYLHIAESPLLVVAIMFLRKISKTLTVLESFPPHQHINGKIIFPKGFSPAVIQTLDLNRP